MRLIEDTREIERVALNRESAFTIKATGKAFRILSSGLYQDKIRAIVRELACNAYDAHVAAGWPERPFRVHLPNVLEPFFAVRDSGVGLSPEEITTVYTTYFESTKTASNAYIGALGLGSKSPFSYVDSFAITSWYHGTCYRYAAYLGEQGEPVINLLSMQPCADPNGVEVTLAVKAAADITLFVHKAAAVLTWFQHRPEVVGCPDFAVAHYETLISGTGWRITDRRHGAGDNPRGAIAVMGNVAYPITCAQIGKLSRQAQRLYTIAGLDVTCPIGSLDITAGRESLSYDPATLQTLQQRADAIISEAPTRIQQRFEVCPSSYAAHELYGRLYGAEIARFLFGGEPPPVKFRGGIITTGAVCIDFNQHPLLTAETYTRSQQKFHKHTYRPGVHPLLPIPASPKLLLVIDDLFKRDALQSRIIQSRKTQPQTILVLLRGPADALAALLDQLDGFPCILASAMAKPTYLPMRIPRKSEPVMQMTDLVFDQYQTRLDSACWKPATVKAAQGGLFVPRRGYLVVDETKVGSSLLRALRAAANLHLLDRTTPIYGLNAPMMKRYGTIPGWIALHDHLRSTVQAALNGPMMAPGLLGSMQIRALIDAHPDLIAARPLLFALGRGLPAAHPVAVFAAAWEANHGDSPRRDRQQPDLLHLLCDFLKVEWPVSVSAPVRQLHEFCRTYPLLSLLDTKPARLRPEINGAHLAAYVQWVDATRAAGAASPVAMLQTA